MIPVIAPYPMPRESELPENRVPWRPDPARSLLLVHDMQRYFVDFFEPGRPPLTSLIANIRGLLTATRRLGLPVAFTAQPGGMSASQRGLLRDFWGPGMSRAPHHREIVEELRPGPHETVLTKWRYSAFHRTSLPDLLRERDRDQLIICGVYAHIGCLLTACDAFAFDVQPFLVADAMSDFSPEEHRMALDYAARRCAVVVSTAQTVDALTAADAAAPPPPSSRDTVGVGGPKPKAGES